MARRDSVQESNSRRNSFQKSNSRRGSDDLGLGKLGERRGSIPMIEFLSCEKCKRNVVPQERVDGPLGKPFHAYCLTCDRCGKLLTYDTMDVYQNKPYCEECFLKK